MNTTAPPDLEGIEVCHQARSGDGAINGGRARHGGELKHLQNTACADAGWLGNPYSMDKSTDAVEARRIAIAGYLHAFLNRLQDDGFRQDVEDLRGEKVACWCRGPTQARTPENWCHLDVVDAYLKRDLRPVYDYLRDR